MQCSFFLRGSVQESKFRCLANCSPGSAASMAGMRESISASAEEVQAWTGYQHLIGI